MWVDGLIMNEIKIPTWKFNLVVVEEMINYIDTSIDEDCDIPVKVKSMKWCHHRRDHTVASEDWKKIEGKKSGFIHKWLC